MLFTSGKLGELWLTITQKRFVAITCPEFAVKIRSLKKWLESIFSLKGFDIEADGTEAVVAADHCAIGVLHPPVEKVLPKYKTVIFVNGCFWHKHENCKYFVWPKTNEDFWRTKISANVSRDQENIKLLSELGWNVIVIWECELKKQRFDCTMEKLLYSFQNWNKLNEKHNALFRL